MCMKKIIFLDIDGVLNTEHNQSMLMYHGKTSMVLSLTLMRWLS